MIHFIFSSRLPSLLSVVGGVATCRWLLKKGEPSPSATFDQRELLQLHEESLRWFGRKTAAVEAPRVRATFTKSGHGKIEITGSKPVTKQEAHAVLTLIRAQKGFVWPNAGDTLDIDMSTLLPITTLR